MRRGQRAATDTIRSSSSASRAGWITRDDLNLLVLLFEVATSASDSPACSSGGDEVRDLTGSLFPDLGAGCPVVRLRVCVIVKFVRLKGAGNLGGEVFLAAALPRQVEHPGDLPDAEAVSNGDFELKVDTRHRDAPGPVHREGTKARRVQKYQNDCRRTCFLLRVFAPSR